jgi:hypothetical protein
LIDSWLQLLPPSRAQQQQQQQQHQLAVSHAVLERLRLLWAAMSSAAEYQPLLLAGIVVRTALPTMQQVQHKLQATLGAPGNSSSSSSSSSSQKAGDVR